MRELAELLRPYGLMALGGFYPDPKDTDLAGVGTLVLIGPDGPHMWPEFSASSESSDGKPDPLDRWSKRVIGAVAATIGGRAVFPSDGPPYPSFISWALRTGVIYSSPVQMLVHVDAGLMVSFRGAILVPEVIEIAPSQPSPCERCATRPCLVSCPIGVLGADGYDVEGCRAFVKTKGVSCRQSGCLVRRACPISAEFDRPEAQSGFHMEAFI